MPLDALPIPGFSRRRLPPAVPSLDQAERDASVRFTPLLLQQLGNRSMTDHPLILIVRMTADLNTTSVRLIRGSDAAETMSPGETALAWVVQGVPNSEAKRRALAVRLASAAAVAWRQHCQIQRLGFLNA